MVHVNSYINIRFFFVLAVVALSAACMPKVEEDDVVPIVSLDNSAISGSANSEMKVVLTGKCPSSTQMLRIMINSAEYTVESLRSLSSPTSNSGIPVGSCSNGVLTIQYPVPNPTLSRTITFKVKARLADGRSSVEWATKVVNYTPPPPTVPGYAVLAVGGIGTGTNVLMHGAGGEPASPNVLTDAQTQLRTGLHGVITD